MFRPRHPMQFLVALIAASLLWYALAAQRNENISVRGVKARLTLVNIPNDLVLTSSVPDTVSLQLRGPLSRALSPPEVLLDLADARPGLNSYPIHERDIEELPDEVDVVSVDPSAITLELERQETRQLPVKPVIDGVPAIGFMVGEIRVIPSQYTVQGPESLLLALDSVATSAISIEGASGPLEAMAQPVLPDPLLRPLGPGTIQVLVDVIPEPLPDEAEAAQQ